MERGNRGKNSNVSNCVWKSFKCVCTYPYFPPFHQEDHVCCWFYCYCLLCPLLRSTSWHCTFFTPHPAPPVANTIRTPSIIYSFIGNELPTNIRCSFYGYPYPWILMYDTETGWLVSNGTQEANYKVYTDKKESVRYFRTYRCLAKNKYGIRNSTVTLKHAG